MTTNRKSKFSGLFEPAPPASDAPPPALPADVEHGPTQTSEAPVVAAPVGEQVHTDSDPAQTMTRRPRRASGQRASSREAQPARMPAARAGRGGKRNDPNYFQATAYIPQQLKEEVDIKLIRARRQRPELDFSVLMEELLQQWLNEKT